MKINAVCSVAALLFCSVAFCGMYADGTDDPNSIDAGVRGFIDQQLNPVFAGWASKVIDYSPSDDTTFYGIDGIGVLNNYEFSNPTNALGEVTGSNVDIVSLGDLNWEPGVTYDSNDLPGTITLGFDSSISDGPGPDFAVFENSFGSNGLISAELAFVEVSTNCVNFVRFPNYYYAATESVGILGSIDVTKVYNLAGKHINAYSGSYGTPFDLYELSDHQMVTEGLVDLSDINYVRIVDIAGNGYFEDSFGHLIYDMWETQGSGGFDLEAVGVINTIYGDADSDGSVGMSDFIRLSSNWGRAGGWPQGDFDLDGVVNENDLILLASGWLVN
ncbi:MAG: PEP-CTERM sorting domain-containing protein [Sedimentisphaeraceae bacterium JB056]